MKMDNKVYDVLVRIVKYILPALGSLYFGLSQKGPGADIRFFRP